MNNDALPSPTTGGAIADTERASQPGLSLKTTSPKDFLAALKLLDGAQVPNPAHAERMHTIRTAGLTEAHVSATSWAPGAISIDPTPTETLGDLCNLVILLEHQLSLRYEERNIDWDLGAPTTYDPKELVQAINSLAAEADHYAGRKATDAASIQNKLSQLQPSLGL